MEENLGTGRGSGDAGGGDAGVALGGRAGGISFDGAGTLSGDAFRMIGDKVKGRTSSFASVDGFDRSDDARLGLPWASTSGSVNTFGDCCCCRCNALPLDVGLLKSLYIFWIVGGIVGVRSLCSIGGGEGDGAT